MGLFSLFSNDDAEAAARQRNEGLQAGYTALSNTFQAGRDTLSGDFAKGRDAATTNYGNANSLYAGLSDYFKQQYGGGAQAYGDFAGANGAEGSARARANFQADPGRDFIMDQQLQALQRTHAAAGNLNSGNADADTLKLASGNADQAWGSYGARLAPYLQLAGAGQTAAVTGQATGDQHLGNTLDASYRGEGTGQNASLMGQGTAANANFTGQGASNAAATMNNYNVGANQFNGLVSAGKLASNLFGSFG